MAHGLETRSPFLDVELAEFVLGLPWRLRFTSPSPGTPGEGRGEGSSLRYASAKTLTPSLSGVPGEGAQAPTPV
jgi:hypothetical protein